MSTDSGAFYLLDQRIQRFIWSQGWTELRDAQEHAIPFIVEGDRDVIVAAATAAGKTEAAFLPALTYILNNEGSRDLIVYISPLKALINDQFGRLDLLCDDLDIQVWPWHGDISSSQKQAFLKRPRGVLLITPESVEALLCNRGTAVGGIFARAAFFVIDELHAFIGSERGKQLQSLMHRLDIALERKTPRIGLSATLGDMRLAANFLRPGAGANVAIVESKSAQAELRILVKGYEEPLVPVASGAPPAEVEDTDKAVTPGHIASHLFTSLRGTNNLIFPNSRRQVELYTHMLSAMCAGARIPNEFWPHHGSLSKELRSETERALKQKERPASAICTNTLELGIDIGAVKSVAQIGPPPSVAALKQRLGRSGRRKGEPAILRGYCEQQAMDQHSSLSEVLRLGTVQMIAMISLMLEGWFEPPATQGAHLSTLVQQILSVVAQNGGISAGRAYNALVGSDGPFAGVSPDEFKMLLVELGRRELLLQDPGGLLLHAPKGEALVNHYSFYAAFATDEEFRLVAGGKTLGTLPVSQLLRSGQNILFAGKTWCVEMIDEEQKTIHVRRTRGGRPPQFTGGPGAIHTRVRQRMREILNSRDPVPYLDATGARFLDEARSAFAVMGLKDRVLLEAGPLICLMSWKGTPVNEAIVQMLNARGVRATHDGPMIEVSHASISRPELEHLLREIASRDAPTIDDVLAQAFNLEREKWDWALPEPLLRKAYASRHLDIAEAMAWLRETFGAQDGTHERPVDENAEQTPPAALPHAHDHGKAGGGL